MSHTKLHHVLVLITGLIFCFSTPLYAAGNCSPYIGQATLNEFFKDQSNMSNDPDDFAEVKILNGSIPSSTYENWTIKICEDDDAGNNNDADDCSADILLSSFTNTTLPWLVLKGAGLPTQLGQHINFKTGFDATLLDENGDLIDYITVDGYSKAISGITCSLSNLVYDYTASSPGASDKTIFRSPDGTGVWDSAPSATAPPTEDSTNDPLPPPPSGESYPYVTINNVSLSTPGTALFTVSLTDATGNPTTFGQAVTISYFTQDGTATAADNDFTEVPISAPLTVTIAAGQSSTTLTIDSPSSTNADVDEYFFAVLQAIQDSAANGGSPNASISKHYGTATLNGPLAEWNFDICTVSSPFDIKDTSGNNLHASPNNDVSTAAGYICSAGSFDGNDDYVSLPSFPNLTASFTISAWIRPNAINNDQRIFVDDESNSGGFAFSLGDPGDGRLRFFSRNVSPVSLDSSTIISAGNWYHVVAVHDSVNKTRQIFVNGADVTGGAQTYTGSWGTDSGLASIGGETDGAGSEANSNWRFDGLIDEVRVYSRALSTAEITSYYNNPNPNNRVCPTCFAPTCDTFRDEFSTENYSRQDGTVNWATNWIETGDNNNPSNGDIEIRNGELQLEGGGASPSIEREANLSGYDSATLTFDYRTSGNWESSDNLRIYFSNNGGSSWTLQDTISNDQASNTYSALLAAANLTSNFRIRFVEGANQNSELFHIDNLQINACTISSIHHIEFIHDGSALTCNPEQVTVKACTNAACSTLATTDITATLSPTGWVGGDTNTFTGTANYNLQKTTVGIVTLGTSSTAPVASNPVVCKNAGGTVISCDMVFSDSGFIFTVPTQTSCATSSDITVQAVRLDATTQTCVPAFQNVNRNLKVWASYNDPVPADITGTPAVTLINDNDTYSPIPSTEPGSTNVTMSFANAADETFTVSYPDAGQLTLNMKYEGSAANSDTGLTMQGSDSFVVSPAKLYVYSDDTNAACASNDATCSAFKPAGNAADSQFNLKVRAACADNSVTPNFALNNIAITHTNTAPAGIPGNILVSSFDMATSDNGEHIISTQALSEVGVFTFTATSPTYLGVTGPVGTSTYIGRIYPHHFDTTVNPGCNTFTYSGQDFTVTTTAQNNWLPIPSETRNYAGTFAFDTELSNAGDTSNFNSTNTIAAASFINGTASKPDVTYTFATKETPPVTITLRANDPDTSGTTGIVEGATEIRSGRTRIENAFGSELVDMFIPAQVEYYNTNGFEINTADTCSTIDVILTDIGADPITLGTGVGQTCIWDDADNSVGGTDFTCLADATKPQFSEPPTNGSFNINLKSPGANNTGDIGVTLTSPPWLQYDWDDNGTHDNDPTGTASFGLYRGDDRIIYWREVFQ